MEWEEHLEFLLLRKKKGKPTPAIDGRPILRKDLTDIWNYFSELVYYRQYGFSANPLQLSEISTYLDEQGVKNPERRRWVSSLLKKMDIEWLICMKEKNERRT